MQFHERARAKVNLTLRVLGRRPDGYHDLESLVAFAEVADRLTMDLAAPRGLTVTGPFGGALAGQDNLVEKAMAELAAVQPGIRIGHVTLDKQLPVAAGIGGGSADAGAVLRLIQAANPSIGFDALTRVGAQLGADVPVCVVSQPSLMTGTGTDVTPLATLPALHAVLVNPLAPVPGDKTAAVFRRLAAAASTGSAHDAAKIAARWAAIESADSLIEELAREINDLEAPATAVIPLIAEVIEALRGVPGTRLARLSGAGPTCFALFGTETEAEQAAEMLSQTRPQWWVVATTLLGSHS